MVAEIARFMGNNISNAFRLNLGPRYASRRVTSVSMLGPELPGMATCSVQRAHLEVVPPRTYLTCPAWPVPSPASLRALHNRGCSWGLMPPASRRDRVV